VVEEHHQAVLHQILQKEQTVQIQFLTQLHLLVVEQVDHQVMVQEMLLDNQVVLVVEEIIMEEQLVEEQETLLQQVLLKVFWWFRSRYST
jgi:hypothetical protein